MSVGKPERSANAGLGSLSTATNRAAPNASTRKRNPSNLPLRRMWVNADIGDPVVGPSVWGLTAS